MKIKSAQLSPYTLSHMLKGVVVVADPKRGVIIRSRPTRKKPRTLLQKQYSRRFGFAGAMASNSEVMQLQTAIEMSKGTEQVPRDILTMAALGNYYILLNQDGTEWDHVEGPVYKGRKWKTSEMEIWTRYNTINSTGYGTSARAFKGFTFTPLRTLEVTGFKVVLQTLATASYQIAVGIENASHVIQSISKSSIQFGGISVHNVLHFEMPFTFSQNNSYFLMVGRTDGAGSYALPIAGSTEDALTFPHTLGGGVAYNSVNPVVGNTLFFSAGATQPFGFLF